MGEEEQDDSFNLLSLKDFEERGIKIDKKWTGFDALVAVASLASKKLEEERIRKEKQKKPFEDQLFGQANSPNTSEPWAWLARVRVSEKKHKEKAPKKPFTNDLYSKKAQGLYNKAPNYKLMGDAMKAGFPRHDDGDWVAEYSKQKKLKRGFTQAFSTPNKKPKRENPFVLDEIPDLPQEFKERIQQLNGSKIGLVIQKSLFQTDVSNHHYRLSIPVNQIVAKEFLTDDEKRYLDNGGDQMRVKLIEPLLQQCEMTFKRADNPNDKNNKVKAKSSFCYVLIRDWNKVRIRNKLKLNDTIQLWKFRLPNEQIGLALVLVARNGSNVCEDNSKKLGDDQSPTNTATGSTTTDEDELSYECELL